MDLSDARVFVIGLLVDCPYESNPTDCVLHDKRGKSLEEKIEFTRRLAEEEVRHIIAIHKKCLSRKEAKGRNRMEN